MSIYSILLSIKYIVYWICAVLAHWITGRKSNITYIFISWWLVNNKALSHPPIDNIYLVSRRRTLLQPLHMLLPLPGDVCKAGKLFPLLLEMFFLSNHFPTSFTIVSAWRWLLQVNKTTIAFNTSSVISNSYKQ